jgi:short-subunit dehydrogenase involved in D-alanine esterification of teichoic acids
MGLEITKAILNNGNKVIATSRNTKDMLEKLDGNLSDLLVLDLDITNEQDGKKTISTYGFFSYAIAEALHLSEKEREIIMSLLQQIKNELKNNIDNYSQDKVQF